MLTHSFIGRKFERREGTLVLVENAKTFETFVATGVLSRSLTTEAPDDAPVVVVLEDDEIDFLGAEEPEPFVTFLRHAYLTISEPEWLVLADVKPLYDLLHETLPTLRDSVPSVTRDELLRRYYPRGLFRRTPSTLTDRALRVVKRGTTFRGMFSVCSHDGEPLCYSTYACIEEKVCLAMYTYDGDLSETLELFPFRIQNIRD